MQVHGFSLSLVASNYPSREDYRYSFGGKRLKVLSRAQAIAFLFWLKIVYMLYSVQKEGCWGIFTCVR